MTNLCEHTIKSKSTCIEALKRLDSVKLSQTLFVINENGTLIGTVTDGDIRRGLIKGLSVQDPVEFFSFPDFKFIKGSVDVKEVQRLRKLGIKILPKLNDQGHIEKIYDLSKLNSILPVQALIMAGGRGERLRPLTDNTPKPMLIIGNKPIIEHNIDHLISYGVESITISVHYLSEQIINYFGDGGKKGIKINYLNEEVPMGTIGCLSSLNNIEMESILLLNSDLFTNIDYEDLYLNFIAVDADMAVASIPYSVDIPYAIMELADNTIVSYKEKPKNTYYANAGIYLIKRDLIKIVPKNKFFNATDLMDLVISNAGKLIHSPITGYWIDIGRYDDLNKAREIIKHIKEES